MSSPIERESNMKKNYNFLTIMTINKRDVRIKIYWKFSKHINY